MKRSLGTSIQTDSQKDSEKQKGAKEKISPGEVREFRKLLKKVFYTNPNWRGVGKEGSTIDINTTRFIADSDNREKIQTSGASNFCHTCLEDITSDTNQPFIGDHIPPKEIYNKFFGNGLEKIFPNTWDKGFVLLAHCDECAARQSGLVKRLCLESDIVSAYNALGAKDKKLVTGGRRGMIKGNSGSVTKQQGQQVQNEGVKKGCHSCSPAKKNYPNKIYHADHFPPAELLTSYMKALIAKLDLGGIKVDQLGNTIDTFLAEPELRPQCARCSHEQGGLANELSRTAIKLARKAGITVYK